MNELLKGTYDLHVHTAPDVVPRKCSDVQLAERMRAAGMAGGAIKSHYLDTAGRAGILRELYPELTIVGGIVLNRRSVDREEEKVRAFADANDLPIVADIPRSDDIIRFED